MEMKNQRARLRDLGIVIGRFPTGKHNAITDVPGVLVGHKTLICDKEHTVRTGVTAIVPREGKIHEDFSFAGFYSFNGIGEMTGIPLLDEWGVLTSPVVLTNTNQVGMAWDAVTRYGSQHFGGFAYKLPVVAETYDGFLSDIDSFPLTEADVIAALEAAKGGPVAEGNVGGGTGMIAYEFKGGIGTASRLAAMEDEQYTIGVLVQANHGSRHLFQVNGVPVGLELSTGRVASPFGLPSEEDPQAPIPQIESSSIIIIIATDAPLIPVQCKRLAQRATIGLARTGGVGFNSSGDLFLAFSTANHYPTHTSQPIDLRMLHQGMMDPLFEATAEAVEEAILNAVTSADTMTGFQGRTAHALPLDELVRLMKKYNRLS
jgi:D-aminopeptidase